MLSVPRVALRRGLIAVEMSSRAAFFCNQQVRHISSKDIFNYTAQAGESVLGELGLLSWWKPSSYFRMALEAIHMHADIPWWTTIVCEQQIFMEQRDFLKAKDIRLGRQFLILLANGAVFATQFFAIRKMVDVNYPGLSTGGTAWFTDLTIADPYYALPLISALTMGLVTRVGIEMGTSSDQMTPMMRVGMLYALPVVIFAVSSQFASGLCVYWCASNMMSLFYAGAFRTPAIRKLFNIPPLVHDPTTQKKKNAFKEIMAGYKANKSIPPTLAQLKEQDAQQFKKAGRGKPIVKS
ncbi:hypothetical protein TELCIR_06598 [Teladorsagia circumcincta]|uniref:Membrane insertase YidC/Oxa/ALB C-terminal domain-containing protein n=2 Tax=Teladorsagia circumcincta TaxID=45464 RepID=A0A2G9UMM9_TELCI|nr:hypothetical protein TELCIR_06598 [Teladorsagia circumcincta]